MIIPIQFSDNVLTPEEIEHYYKEVEKSIEMRFNKEQNANYVGDFLGYTEEEIISSKKELLQELSIEASFFLLAYIESLFRKDFILRINAGRKKYRDNITKEYKSIYVPYKRVYSYSLVDVIFSTWKQYVSPNSKELEDVFRTLPQYYDFRNWIAHGRYWVPKETNYIQKYSYLQIVILYDKIKALLGDKLKK